MSYSKEQSMTKTILFTTILVFHVKNVTMQFSCEVQRTPLWVTYSGSDSELVMYNGTSLILFRRPKSLIHYPRVTREIKVNCDLIKRLTAIYYYNSRWYSFANSTADDKRAFIFNTLATCSYEHFSVDRSQASDKGFHKFSFLDNNFYSKNVFIRDVFVVHADPGTPCVIIYPYSKSNYLKPEVKGADGFIMSGTYLEEENWAGAPVDVFDQYSKQSIYGYEANENYFRIFRFTDNNLHRSFSHYFQNDALVGCPIDLCIYSSFDSVATIGGRHLFFSGPFYWSFTDTKTNLRSVQPVNLNDFITVDGYEQFYYTDEVFYYDNQTFALIDGDIFTRTDGEETWIQTDSELVFGEEARIRAVNIDAVAVIGENAFVFMDSEYLVINMKTLKLSKEYASQMDIGENYFPRPIDDFPTFPSFIDAYFTKSESEVYFFHAGFAYKLNSWTGQYPIPTPEGYLIQEEVFNCKNTRFPDFMPYTTTNDFVNFMQRLKPTEYSRDKYLSIKKALIILIITIIAILAVGIFVGFAVSGYAKYTGAGDRKRDKLTQKSGLSVKSTLSSQLISRESGFAGALNSKID